MGVHIVAERAVERTGALVQQAGVHALVGFQAAQRCVAEKSTQQLSTLIFLSWKWSRLTPSQKSSFSCQAPDSLRLEIAVSVLVDHAP